MVYMKCRRWDLIRWMFLLLMVAYIIVCRYNPSWAEGYARNVYPWMSSTLSAFSSLLPFSLDECFVVLAILWLLVYPFIKRKKIRAAVKRNHSSFILNIHTSAFFKFVMAPDL